MLSLFATWLPTTPATPAAPASSGCQTVVIPPAASHYTAMSWATFGLIAFVVIAAVALGAYFAEPRK